MPKPTRQAEKLLSTVVGRPRQRFSVSTKRALVAVARQMFTEHGYRNTSLDSVVAGAEVTKGALYHHFGGKQALFQAVFEEIEEETSQRIRTALAGESDPWRKARKGLVAFLEVVQDPGYQRIVIQEGPAILGYERFREQEERSTFGIVHDIVRGALEVSTYELDEQMVDVFSRIFFGAMTTAGEHVSSAEDTSFAAAQVQVAITFILAGLESLAESGRELPAPEDLMAEQLTDESALPSPRDPVTGLEIEAEESS